MMVTELVSLLRSPIVVEVLTPPVPESCIWEKPVTLVVSDANPAWLSPAVSATALAMPKVSLEE